MMLKKLNVGCGNDYRKGWINIDYHDEKGADVVFNLTNLYKGKKMPFKDKTFDVILLRNVLEHLPEPLPILRELYRILKVGGTLQIEVPYGQSVWYNLDHKHPFFLGSFNTKNFKDYCAYGKKEVEVIEKKLYINPTKNILKKIIYSIFLKIANSLISRGSESWYDQTIIKDFFQNTQIYVKYVKVD